LRHVGEVILPSYGAVLNYAPAANTLFGCVVAVEGCMDSYAINYDVAANVNKNTWCVPKVMGCMMPLSHNPSMNFHGSGDRAHTRDGLSIDYMTEATVAGHCVIERYGCTDSMAFNYDSHATVNFDCYEDTGGCLDNEAVNFNCTARGSDVAGSYVEYTAACTQSSPRLTRHFPAACNMPSISPPPPPGNWDEGDTSQEQSRESGKIKDISVSSVIQVQGAMEEFGEDTAAATATRYRASVFTGFSPKDMEKVGVTAVTYTPGSVNVHIVTPVSDKGTFDKAAAASDEAFKSLAATSAMTGAQAMSIPVTSAVIVYEYDPLAVILGGVLGGGLGGLIVIVGIFLLVRKSKKVEA